MLLSSNYDVQITVFLPSLNYDVQSGYHQKPCKLSGMHRLWQFSSLPILLYLYYHIGNFHNQFVHVSWSCRMSWKQLHSHLHDRIEWYCFQSSFPPPINDHNFSITNKPSQNTSFPNHQFQILHLLIDPVVVPFFIRIFSLFTVCVLSYVHRRI